MYRLDGRHVATAAAGERRRATGLKLEMLDFGVRMTRHFFGPTEPQIEADLWLIGVALIALSACLTVGAVVVWVI